MTQRSSSSGDQFSVHNTGSASNTDPSATQPFNATANTGGMSQSGSGQRAIDQAKQTAGNVTEQAKEQAGQLADQARTQVTSRISGQKERAAEGLGSMAQALRQTGQQLRDQDQSGVTQYVDQAAEQVERLSNYLRQNEVGDLVNDVERFARRQPALFISGAFTIGLLAARFLKSSSPQSQPSRGYTGSRMYNDSGYGTSGYGYSRPAGSSYGAASSNTGYDTAYGATEQARGYGASSTSGLGSTGYGASSTSDFGATGLGSSSGMTTRTGLAGANTSDTGSDVNSSQFGSLGSTDSSSTTSSRYGSAEDSRERGGREGA
jgi:hypothetical protein